MIRRESQEREYSGAFESGLEVLVRLTVRSER